MSKYDKDSPTTEWPGGSSCSLSGPVFIVKTDKDKNKKPLTADLPPAQISTGSGCSITVPIRYE